MILNPENMDAIKNQLILHEGIRNKPYRCTAGKLTIGVGRNLDDVGLRPSEINYLLENDIVHCIEVLKREFDWYNTLSPVRQRVLIDMVFNLGLTGLSNFPKFLGALKAGNWKEATREMKDSLWYRQVKSRAKRLCQMMATNEGVL